MRILIVAVGRMKNGPERELVARYLDRAMATGRSLGLSSFTITELTESRAGNATTRQTEEAAAIHAALPDKSAVVVLDERGKGLSSADFARKLGNWRDDGRTALALVIGGPDGVSAAIREAADMVMSFSPMTWPHQIVRIMAAEQLYRATTILSGHPYHRGD